jgi:hypothetical protein
MSDKQIIDYFEKANGKTCGKFLPHQLHTFALREPLKIKPGFNFLKAGLLSMVLFAISRPASAQLPAKRADTEILSSPHTAQDSILFRGVVTSAEDGSPLPGVNVVLKGSAIGTSTDADGRFNFSKTT